MQPSKEWQHQDWSIFYLWVEITTQKPTWISLIMIIQLYTEPEACLLDFKFIQNLSDGKWMKNAKADRPWALTTFTHQRVIRRRPTAFDGPRPQRPIEIISQGMLPAAEAVLKGAGHPTVLLVCAIGAVIDKVAGLPWIKVVAVIARQGVWGTGTCKC